MRNVVRWKFVQHLLSLSIHDALPRLPVPPPLSLGCTFRIVSSASRATCQTIRHVMLVNHALLIRLESQALLMKNGFNSYKVISFDET